MPLILGICGVTGRTGSQVLTVARQSRLFSQIIGFCKSASPLPELEILKDLKAFCDKADVIIDFSLPDVTDALIKASVKCKTPLVIGTTGLTSATQNLIKEASSVIPIIYSANFSLGMAATFYAADLLSKALPSSFLATIEETHHIHKKDSPSGTALMLQSTITKPCPITSHRRGEIIGEHILRFSSSSETIALSHTAHARTAFAEGALFAANSLATRPSGLYTLKDLFVNPLK